MMYLAQPYTGTNSEMLERYRLGCLTTADLFRRGIPVYAPIVHWHEVARCYSLPTDEQSWRNQNLHMVEQADSFSILALKGWRNSKGIWAEFIASQTVHEMKYNLLTITGDNKVLLIFTTAEIITDCFSMRDALNGQDNSQ